MNCIDVTSDICKDIDCPNRCVACKSHKIFYLGAMQPSWDFPVQHIPVIICRECGTCMTPHNRQDIADETNNLPWHLSVEERNRGWSKKIIKCIRQTCGKKDKWIEIGCGAGWLLDEIKKAGMSGIGFETNIGAVNFATQNLSLDVRCEMWNVHSVENFDILCCISVLEHLENPDELLLPIAQACKKNNAIALLSVPAFGESPSTFLHKHIFPFLNDTKNQAMENLLRLVPAHVTHYSHVGFIKHLESVGAKHIEVVAWGWKIYKCIF